MRRFLELLCVLMLSVPLVQAQEQPLTIYSRLTLPFMPEQAFFFVELQNGQYRRFNALVVPERGEKYLIGTRFTLGDYRGPLAYSLLAVGKGYQFRFQPAESMDLSNNPLAFATADVIRTELLTRKGILQSWELQLKAQENSLRRLRADAEVIADLGRIVDVKSEVDRANQEAQFLNKDLENLKKFLSFAKMRASPQNFVGRQSQLIKQLSEIEQSLKQAEGSEFNRLRNAENDLQTQLQVIERARAENYEELEKELIRMRKKRAGLEGKAHISGGSR